MKLGQEGFAFLKPLTKFVPKRPAFVDRIAAFVNGRNPREKVMILVFGACFLFTIDYFLVLRPIIGAFSGGAELSAKKAELQGLRDDRKNKDKIEAMWTRTKERLDKSESAFIAPDEVPSLLENLSKLASASGLRIVSLKPDEQTAGEAGPYAKVPIRISAQAGGHELGRFLGRLEASPTFFRVADLRVVENPSDARRHEIQLEIETYRRRS